MSLYQAMNLSYRCEDCGMLFKLLQELLGQNFTVPAGLPQSIPGTRYVLGCCKHEIVNAWQYHKHAEILTVSYYVSMNTESQTIHTYSM